METGSVCKHYNKQRRIALGFSYIAFNTNKTTALPKKRKTIVEGNPETGNLGMARH
jgi:hypothetical protein